MGIGRVVRTSEPVQTSTQYQDRARVRRNHGPAPRFSACDNPQLPIRRMARLSIRLGYHLLKSRAATHTTARWTTHLLQITFHPDGALTRSLNGSFGGKPFSLLTMSTVLTLTPPTALLQRPCLTPRKSGVLSHVTDLTGHFTQATGTFTPELPTRLGVGLRSNYSNLLRLSNSSATEKRNCGP